MTLNFIGNYVRAETENITFGIVAAVKSAFDFA